MGPLASFFVDDATVFQPRKFPRRAENTLRTLPLKYV